MDSEAAISTPSSPQADALAARLTRYGLLSVAGEDARSFLHAQLTNDIENLPADRARLAGWCSAKGRLLANFVVIPWQKGFLLHLSRDLAPTVAKRLGMFVLRAKVKISDLSDSLTQFGLWGPGAAARVAAFGLPVAQGALSVVSAGDLIAVRLGDEQFLLVAEAQAGALAAGSANLAGHEDQWALLEIRAGRPWLGQSTQDMFVPQMVNLEAIGGVDFRKGCYPGQEIVARAQYRGQIKRRMIRARVPAGVSLNAGQNLYSDTLADQAGGTVVNVAPAADGSELLAVVQIGVVAEHSPIRVTPNGPELELQPLPYAK
jgi:tRNA-modifying protein YgfZ